ncbi:MAG: DUF3450 family protein [Planctomycetota bacterium]
MPRSIARSRRASPARPSWCAADSTTVASSGFARLEPDAAELAPEQRLERFWTFVQEELRLARGAELYTIELSLDRTHAKHALVFRVGQLLQGFLTEDGLEAGLEEPGGWQVARAPALERAVRAAVEMLNRQRAPALLALPVSVPITVSGMR